MPRYGQLAHIGWLEGRWIGPRIRPRARRPPAPRRRRRQVRRRAAGPRRRRNLRRRHPRRQRTAREPVDRWSHLALTYDGSMLRLYENGAQVSSRPMTGGIATTNDPLWIGGNHSVRGYFQGEVDEVRVMTGHWALRRSATRWRPRSEGPPTRVVRTGGGVWVRPGCGKDRPGFLRPGQRGHDDRGKRGEAAVGTEERCGWRAGVRTCGFPAAPSLDLRRAMTLSAWMRPSDSQAGWRTSCIARPMCTF